MSRRSTSWIPGHDSFLDVVANLVGILIILVAVLGKEVESDIVADGTQTISEQQAREALESLRASAVARQELQRMQLAQLEHDQELMIRRAERDQLLDLLTMARERWEEVKQTLAAETQERLALEVKHQELSRDLAGMEREADRSKEQPIVAVEHLPTPMARTVFEEELHFRLSGGRLSVVPLDVLLEQMKLDFRRTLNSTSREQVQRNIVGPINDYIAEYEVSLEQRMIRQGGQTGTAMVASLQQLTILPVREDVGVPIEQAIQTGGIVQIELAGRVPAKTTITVWVYPDSFAEFRALKEHLYHLGYPTAARPLPMGRPIMGSPDGSRSSAQ
jgi:hypothetical protein